ncbi:related to nasopharyngeal carcinoma susceptibility protein LZ16 [Phialocephala subalpina]|uniref:Related to nasopharyngeal carcinoma susceptibility protein LZ16 n=1 Tax=Phialocephala subalpina TaxID=576137 RepID=A0A1L7X7D3_9HELO|nr:related to nasopharyngeal carcinoma susceptibility protein LZ16 [Phialocephala subalpina]
MVSRKRKAIEEAVPELPKERSLLDRIRNMWEFSNLSQWIFTFGHAVKLDENLDVEELEMECLKHNSTVLPEIGLALLKYVSSHRGLTPEIFDEYTRRQYVAKAPERNPFGIEEEPNKFNDFDIFTKIRVLQQLTQWTFVNPDKIREKMDEQKDAEQTIWRIEPFGWDSEDRTYFVLDDNRLYRRTDPPPPPPPARKPKKNSKKAKAASRASKRRKISEPAETDAEPTEDDNNGEQAAEKEDDGFGDMVWECLAVSLDEFNAFTASIEKSRDPNEKTLRKRIVDDVLPLLEKQEEARKRKQAQKERELLNLEKLATAKRSSRIAGKMEQHKQEQEAREAERKRETELAMAKKEQEKWLKLEKERESRMMTREQRLKEREARRILHEEELANLSEDSKKIETGEGRLSERHLKAEIERKKQALKELTEEEDWIFDCICGAYGQIDDGTHSIACDKCNIWQHSKCVGVSQVEAERDDFTFICKTCVRRAEDVERAKTHPPIKIKINRPGSSSSATPKQEGSQAVGIKINGKQSYQQPSPQVGKSTQGNHLPPLHSFPTPHAQATFSWQHAPSASPQKASPQKTSPQAYSATPKYPQQSNGQYPTMQPASSPMRPPSSGYSGPYGPYQSNGTPAAASPYGPPRPASSHAFSSPHPHSPISLPPPAQPQQYTFVNGNHNGSPYQPVASSPASQNPSARYSPMQGSTPYAAAQNSGPPQSQIANGPSARSADDGQRRSSVNLLSPLAAAPVLTPMDNASVASSFSGPSGAPTGSGPILPKASSQPSVKSPVQSEVVQQNGDSHSSALPSSMTGISPTKHSPPRPSTSNGSFGSATPSVLPPVASLSPSPRLQDPTPPIKHSDSDPNRPAGQSISS